MPLTRHELLARELAKSFLHKGKEHLVVPRARRSAIHRDLPMLEGGCQEFEHIQGACEAPRPVGRLGARVSAGNEGEKHRAVYLWEQTGGVIVGLVLAIVGNL